MKPITAYLGLFALLFFCLTYAHQKKFNAPTPVSRLDLLHALVVQGTVSIDAYHENTPDKAVRDGRYYSDKAPGTVAVALLPFALAVAVLGVAGIDLGSDVGWLISSWIASAGSIGLVTALGGVAMFAWLSRHVPPRSALVTTLAVFLGAAPLPYSTMIFSHALVVGLLAIAVWAIHESTVKPPTDSSVIRAPSPPAGEGRGEGGQLKKGAEVELRAGSRSYWGTSSREYRWELLAGFACGWALASEYSSGLVVVGLALWVGARGWRRLIPFSLAIIPPLLLIPAYSWACFGDPFTLPYSYQASFPAMSEGLYAIKWPDAETAFRLLFSPARGLFFWSPFLLLAGFGYWQLMQKSAGLFWLTYAIPVLQVAVISGRVWDWPAGPAWGPRLLSPMLPLLALPCAYGVSRFPWVGLPLAAYSILVTSVATLTDACPPYDVHLNPLLELNLPALLNGELSPNLGMAMGLPAHASVALCYLVLILCGIWLWRGLSASSLQSEIQT
ncbi:MAG: hypothetical protein KJ072_20015 [Verrucomicrobia bacterium]|nr:hypothetical protein [Verrucomicrobiota bacterium]